MDILLRMTHLNRVKNRIHPSSNGWRRGPIALRSLAASYQIELGYERFKDDSTHYGQSKLDEIDEYENYEDNDG